MLKFALNLLNLGLNGHEINVNYSPGGTITEDETMYSGEYTATMYIGTPLQAVKNVVLDTGSYLAWIGDEALCNSITLKNAGCFNDYTFDSSRSSTFV